MEVMRYDIDDERNRLTVFVCARVNKVYQVAIASVSHLFPFRTEKLSPTAPMVLQCNVGE